MHENQIIRFLRELVNIKSISSDPSKKLESKKCAEFLAKKIQQLGGTTQIVENEEQWNPIVLGKIGNDPKKETLTLYSHYDVQPADISDGWATEPFNLIEKDGNLYGRGATDDKGPIAATLFAIEEISNLGELPVNLRLIYEGEEESGSRGFEPIILQNSEWFAGTNCIVVLDNYWLSTDQPCLTYGLRGMVYLEIQVSGFHRDLHSGSEGGYVFEPLNDLIQIMSYLAKTNGEVQIPGFYDKVQPETDDEITANTLRP